MGEKGNQTQFVVPAAPFPPLSSATPPATKTQPSFRPHPHRRRKGQLNAACAELAKLGLEKIPAIGLAKEFEEIYRPGQSAPLRLGLDHPAVKLLQRVRDESHRVANSYNAQLRLKKNLGEHPRRLPRHRRPAQGGVAEKIWFRASGCAPRLSSSLPKFPASAARRRRS